MCCGGRQGKTIVWCHPVRAGGLIWDFAGHYPEQPRQLWTLQPGSQLTLCSSVCLDRCAVLATWEGSARDFSTMNPVNCIHDIL